MMMLRRMYDPLREGADRLWEEGVTDLEMTKLCAKAMGRKWHDDEHAYYWPLEDDAEAMSLVKKFHLHISIWDKLDGREAGWWRVDSQNMSITTRFADLNRAIVECVAKIQSTKP